MPIEVQRDLSVKAVLKEENILIMDEDRVVSQDIHPLEILILNLIPLKEETEAQLMRALSNTPLQVDCTFLILSTHVSRNTSASHLSKFHIILDEIKEKKHDGVIITGAPVGNLEYEEMNYQPELSMMMERNKICVTSTVHICQGAQAGLYYHYSTPKYLTKKKLPNIRNHRVLDWKVPLVRGLNDFFLVPHPGYTEVRRANISKYPELAILAGSDETGVFLTISRDGRQVLVQGHPEYGRMTLNNEYHRDLDKELDPEAPYNYYGDNDPFSAPSLT